MKYLYALLIAACSVCPARSQAQTFTEIGDTIYISTGPAVAYYFDSIVTGVAPVAYQWKVIDCNFPPDWMDPSRSTFCDRDVCRPLTVLWPSGFASVTSQYLPSDTGMVDLVLDLTTATSTGCYYVTLRLYNPLVPADSADETFFICNSGPLGTPAITAGNKLSIYPNPATTELHITYGNAQGNVVKVSDVLGKEVVVQPMQGTGTTLDIERLPAGVYYLQLFNGQGVSIAREKFIKE